MTEMNDKKISENTVGDMRAKRRRILKAGAVIAPLAITLHGGIPMAHASSVGCIEDMEKHIKVPHFKVKEHDDGDDDDDDNSSGSSSSSSSHSSSGSSSSHSSSSSGNDNDGKHEYERDGRMDSFDPERDSFTDQGNTGRLNDDDTPETHWDYIKNEDEHGASCLQSYDDSGRIYDESDHDSHNSHDDDD
jgi:hypothetical protein